MKGLWLEKPETQRLFGRPRYDDIKMNCTEIKSDGQTGFIWIWT
jgi:hypothetical protein